MDKLLFFFHCTIYVSFFVDPCEKVICKDGEVCRQKRTGKGECECPQCQPVYDFVCGSDDRTYASSCFLKKHACFVGKTINVKAKKPCGMSAVYASYMLVLLALVGRSGKTLKV